MAVPCSSTWPGPARASNPKPVQTAGLLKFGFLDGVPILWTVVVFIALIGVIYYLAVGRRKTFPTVTAPSPDDPVEQAVAGS